MVVQTHLAKTPRTVASDREGDGQRNSPDGQRVGQSAQTSSTATADLNEAAEAAEIASAQNARGSNARGSNAQTQTRPVIREEVEALSPPGSQQQRRADRARRNDDGGGDDNVVLVELTRGWARNMPNEMDSDDAVEAIDLTNVGSQAVEDEIQVVSSNVRRSVVRKRRRQDGAPVLVPAANNANAVETTTSALVLRMLQQQQQAAAELAAQPAEPPSTNPTCGICFEAMGKNTDRQMAAGNCGHGGYRPRPTKIAAPCALTRAHSRSLALARSPVYCRECLTHSVKTRRKCPGCSAKMTCKSIRSIFFDM